ncbi:MAG: hydrogenase nickel incorporation protein HypB [Bacteroidales bacterium]|nr:hydrogenase nickel incorporation protein HypB [Bacteroidales bacterium]
MCDTCGCGDITGIDHHHDHDHGHSHEHDHDHSHGDQHTIPVGRDILDINKRMAERTRAYLEARNIYAINIMSSPGSGKTTLLERTLADLRDKKSFYVIEGDQHTSRDADRISATGVPVVQLNTGNACHLDAAMVNKAVKEFKPQNGSVILIENVGNLICPAMFDLGEMTRIVMMSVTEGEDKPLKYPGMFRTSQLCIINKTDLLPYVNFKVETAIENGLKVNGRLKFLEVSALSGEGMDEWYKWLLANAG